MPAANEGSKLLFDLIHTATGERIPLPKKTNNFFTVVVDEVQDPPCCLSTCISAIATFEHSQKCNFPSRQKTKLAYLLKRYYNTIVEFRYNEHVP